MDEVDSINEDSDVSDHFDNQQLTKSMATDIHFTEDEVAQFEGKRKLLANKSSFPIVSNIEAWNSLQQYRFYQIKNKNIDFLTLWPMYKHPDSACLVSINVI